MHLNTLVKVKAETAKDAISKVNNLITDNGEYHSLGATIFDWFDEEATKISSEIKTEKDFQKLRKAELAEYKVVLKKALALSDTDTMKGYYLMRAGELLNDDIFWSSERLAYFLDWETGKKTFYIETDRHF